MKSLRIVGFILCILFQHATAQSGGAKKCIDAEPLCGSTLFSYPNTSGIHFVDNYADYGCLTVPVNPAWFYFQVSNDGDLQLKISQATEIDGISDLDVDFVAYGPFEDPRFPCESDLKKQHIVDCSFKTDYVEFLNISNAKAGAYYILLITNFSTKPGFITVEQTYGEATTNCNLLSQPEMRNLASCSGNSLILDATTENGHYYEWHEEIAKDSNAFEPIIGYDDKILEVFESKSYKVNIYDCNRVFLKEIIFKPFFYTTPELSHSIDDYVICVDKDETSAMFDLRSKDGEILNGLNPDEFSISYYQDEVNASLGIHALPDVYIPTLPVEIVYARVVNSQSGELSCHDIVSFLLVTDQYPQTELSDSYLLCLNTNGSESVNTPPIIDTALDTITYRFHWYIDDVLLPDEKQGFLIPTSGGTYSVRISRKTTNCTSVFSTEVVTSAPPLFEAHVTSDPFTESNTVEVTVQDRFTNKDYLYRLDTGDWQNDNRFYNVSLGEHTITVLDPLGCGETTKKLMVMDYPLFFTPNGDGENDTWNIIGMPTSWYAKVNIFDRYGKFIKQITPNNLGWDGTLNGLQLPSDDYWFCMEYTNPSTNTNQIFKSHFTLKR